MVLRLLILMLLVPSLCWGGPSARRFSTGPKARHVTQTFTYTGSVQYFTVPATAYRDPAKTIGGVTVNIAGAGGAGTSYYASTNQPGAAGDTLATSFTPGAPLTIYVGGGGQGSTAGCGGRAGGWGFVSGGAGPDCVSGGGGGSSAVTLYGSNYVAPGGDGGGQSGSIAGGRGGNWPAANHLGAAGGGTNSSSPAPSGTDGWVTIDYWQ